MRAGVLAAVATVALTGGVGSASGFPSATTGWRIVATLGRNGPAQHGGLVATGPTDAFSAWCCVYTPSSTDFVLHWNGRHWGKIALPAAMNANVGWQLVTMGASSSSNMWVFANNNGGLASIDKIGIWNGSRWTVRTLPGWVLPIARSGFATGQAVVFGPGNVWVLGGEGLFGPIAVAAHFSGGVWHRVSLPAAPYANAVSAIGLEEIWATGFTKQSLKSAHPVWTVMHWNGSAWRTVALPKASVPTGDSVSYGSPVATGPRSVWLVRTIWSGRTLLSTALLHWDGSWHVPVRVPLATTGIGQISQDGHGGLWMQAWQRSSSSYREYLYHYAGGVWSRESVPAMTGTQASIFNMTWIPGTRSLWAIGTLTTSGGVVTGDILKYGP